MMWLCKVVANNKHRKQRQPVNHSAHHHPNKLVDSMISQMMCHFDNEI
jgi:hypothetical protein